MLLFKNAFILFFCFFVLSVSAQTIGMFNSVQPAAQIQNLVLPSTHTFQRILRSGSTLSSGETVGVNLDFTGYVPINGSSSNGFLSINSETAFANVTVLSLSLNPLNKLWTINSGYNVAFPQPELGYMGPLCAGTVMPNGHVMVCEETAAGPDSNNDNYSDDGWITEVDPATHSVVDQDGVAGADKLWAMGRQAHEDVAMSADMSVAYWSADNSDNGFVYKFIPTVPGNFSSGSLYVLKTTSALGTGTWELVANTTTSDRNNTVALSNAAGAYNFVRIEGLEIGPDGKVYFAATTSGRIYRFHDKGNGVDGLEVFVESTSYDVDGTGPYTPEPWGSGADNLAFDGEGNLWVLQDGENNYIWVVGADHTAASPNVRLFAIIPSGGEPTGITFSPDYKFLFMSVQHPASSNTASQTDAAGNAVVFDNSTAIVIARKENLGAVVLPLNLLSFDLLQKNTAVELDWKLAAVADADFNVERSTNGVTFSKIGTTTEKVSSFHFVDASLPSTAVVYYRLKQTNRDGRTEYSATKSLRLQKGELFTRLYPSPASDNLYLDFMPSAEGPMKLTIVNAAGLTVSQRTIAQSNNYQINLNSLPAGLYYLTVETATGKTTSSFMKQ